MREHSISSMAAILMAFICLGIAAYFLAKIGYQEVQYKQGDAIYDVITEDANAHPENVDPENGRVLNIDFAKLKKINPNIKAWLYCPDTVINYPVCQGKDNKYYLHHLVDGTYNLNGCLFIDKDNQGDFSDENTVIYGHHMKSGKMFASLVKYQKQSYFEKHPVMYLETEEKEYRVELFAGYTTKIGSKAYRLSMDSPLYVQWLRSRYEKSDFDADVTITNNDHVITLSTCAYSFQNARYVVHGKLVDTSK